MIALPPALQNIVPCSTNACSDQKYTFTRELRASTGQIVASLQKWDIVADIHSSANSFNNDFQHTPYFNWIPMSKLYHVALNQM
jgi:hypothetical protein